MDFNCLGRLSNTPNRWLWGRRNSAGHQQHCSSHMGKQEGLGYWLQEVTLARELLNVFNCFQASVAAQGIHLLPLQTVTTSTSCSLPGGTELLLYRLAGNWSQ